MSNQPEWECIAQLGDMNPIDHGGYWVFKDKTGVYCEMGELLVVPEPDSGEKYIVYRFDLERCTWTPKLFDMGVLSDNKFHPDYPAWFAKPEGEKKVRPQDSTYLSNICSFVDLELRELIGMFCSADPIQRAWAYQAIGDYHGFDNLDSYPLELSKREVKQRYKDCK